MAKLFRIVLMRDAHNISEGTYKVALWAVNLAEAVAEARRMLASDEGRSDYRESDGEHWYPLADWLEINPELLSEWRGMVEIRMGLR